MEQIPLKNEGISPDPAREVKNDRKIDSAAYKIRIVAGLKLKETTRRWQAYLWLIIPAFLLCMIYVAYNAMIPGTPYHSYDFAFSGIAAYSAGFLTLRSAISYSDKKKSGMLDRFDTLPLGRQNIFLGSLLGDAVYAIITLAILFGIGFFGLHVYYYNFSDLLIGFVVILIYGIQSIGIGILIAAFSKSPEAANPVGMLYVMTTAFASGSFFIFESPLVYFMPPYWAKQICIQVLMFGNSVTDPMYSSSLVGMGASPLAIPIWGGLLILILMTVGFLVLGIKVFQRKTTL